MDLMRLVTYITLSIFLILDFTAECSAQTFTDLDAFISTPVNIDGHLNNNNYFANYQTRPTALKDSLLSRLKGGYYYIADGKVTPVNSPDSNKNVQTIRRREDSYSNEKDRRIKPKKLFVPNLFG